MTNDHIIYNVIAKKYTYLVQYRWNYIFLCKTFGKFSKGKYICLVEWNIRLTVCVQAGRRNRSWNLRSRRKREEWSLVQIFPFFGFFKEISFAQLSYFWKTFLCDVRAVSHYCNVLSIGDNFLSFCQLFYMFGNFVNYCKQLSV